MSSPHPFGGHFMGKTFVLPVRVYYEDTDFSGIVYHANYLRYFERGRSDCLRAAGVHHTDLWNRDEPLAFTLQEILLKFVAPARIDDLLEVHTVYTRASGARVEAIQSIVRDHDVLVQARVRAAVINAEGKPRRMPKEVVDAMSPYLITDADEQRS